MPGDADPEAQPPAPSVPLADDLAKDLPGLPLELGKVRVDEHGFHRRKRCAAVEDAWRAYVRDGRAMLEHLRW